MRFLHVLIILILIFFCHEFVFAQSSRGAAIRDNVVQTAAGIGGIAAGAALAETTCGPNPTPMCQIGIMMGASSLTTLLNAPKNTKPSSDALAPGSYKGICETDPQLCIGDVTLPNQIPDPTGIIEDFRQIARTQGLNIDDPGALEKYAADHAGDLDSAGGAGSMQMPAAAQAKLEQYKKLIESKYKVSGVEVEGGGGGRGFYGSHKSEKDIDFNSFLEGLNPKEKSEASADGLQRKLASGEPVGVAGDNIFKQVSRRYQVKIQEKLFLAAPKK